MGDGRWAMGMECLQAKKAVLKLWTMRRCRWIPGWTA